MDTNRQRTTVGIAGIVALFVALAGCTTLPEPTSVADTLLVVDVRRQTEEGGSIFGYLETTVVSTEAGGQAATLQLNAGKDYVPVQGLAPGEYRVDQVIFQYQDSNRPQEFPAPSGTVTLKPGTLTVAPWQAIYLIEDLSRGNKMTIGLRELPAEDREVLLQSLREEENFSAWRIEDGM